MKTELEVYSKSALSTKFISYDNKSQYETCKRAENDCIFLYKISIWFVMNPELFFKLNTWVKIPWKRGLKENLLCQTGYKGLYIDQWWLTEATK